MLPYLNIFGLALPLPAITIIIGIWVGLSLMEKHASQSKLDPDTLYSLAFNSLIAGIIGARLVYALKFPGAFIDSPKSLISMNFGLFDLWGGVMVGGITAVIYGQRKNLSLWPTLDALVPAFAVFSIALALSNLASGNAYGSPTGLPWSIQLWGKLRHPTQAYHALVAVGILWAYLRARGRKESAGEPAGVTFLHFVGLTALGTLFIEAFIGASATTLLNLRSVQIYAWLVLGICFWALNQRFLPE